MTDAASKSSEDYKAQGNQAFAQGQYAEAEKLYSQAINADPSNHILFGNRSATRLPQNKCTEALADAEEAIKIDPSWVKGYYRRGMAQIELKLWREAAETFTAAVEKQPKNPELQSRLNQVRSKMQKSDRENPVTSVKHWIQIWGSLGNMKERLHAMACFWNEASKAERHAVFSRFLEVIAGAGQGTTGADFPVDMMMPLPMDNYVDLTLPTPWMDFYKAQDATDKLKVFEMMYASSTSDEQSMIVKDLQFFFLAAQGGGVPEPADDEVDISSGVEDMSLGEGN